MSKKEEVKEAAQKLAARGMDYKLAYKNLLETDRYFIDKLNDVLGYSSELS